LNLDDEDDMDTGDIDTALVEGDVTIATEGVSVSLPGQAYDDDDEDEKKEEEPSVDHKAFFANIKAAMA
jgi:hypothetical protein